jgi:hypothetical protein
MPLGRMRNRCQTLGGSLPRLLAPQRPVRFTAAALTASFLGDSPRTRYAEASPTDPNLPICTFRGEQLLPAAKI